MKHAKKTLVAFAVLLVLAGGVQIVLALTHHQEAGDAETDAFIHDNISFHDGVRYEGLFHKAVTLQMQVASLTVAFHALTGASALVVGLLLLAFAFDRYVDLFGRPAPAAATSEPVSG